MGNENLKHALHTAGLTADELAEIIQVDPKSVQRWLTGTTTPYPRHRAAITRALNLQEHDLWPEHTPAPIPGPAANGNGNSTATGGSDAVSEVVGTWAHANHEDAPDLVAFITGSTGPVDILDSCCGLQITTGVTDALLARATLGSRVRILTDGEAPHWEAVLDHPDVEIYLTEIPGQYWLIKTTDSMLLTINLEHDSAASSPPMLRLTAGSEDGLFDRLAARFEELWGLAGTDQPVVSRSRATGVEDGAQEQPADTGPTAEVTTATLVPAEPTGRRWPGRRD